MKRALAVGCASLLALALALVGFWAWDARRVERETMHYLAGVGGVPPTYQDVQAFLERQFPVGMNRAQVLATLDERFTWSFLDDQDPLDDSYDRIAFPQDEKSCGEDSLRNPNCPIVVYDFEYHQGQLERIAMEPS